MDGWGSISQEDIFERADGYEIQGERIKKQLLIFDFNNLLHY